MTIFEGIFNSLDNWMAASSQNYGVYFAIFGTLLVASMITLVVVYKKIGSQDERTNAIRLRINYSFFVAAFIAMAIYISAINPSIEYISQLSLVPVVVATIASTVVAVSYYLKSR